MDRLIPARLASGLELAVGVMMIFLGLDVIRRALSSRIHFHSHSHDQGQLHFHAHHHSKLELSKHNNEEAHKHQHAQDVPLRAFLLGLLHGLAGSAALVVLFADQVESFFIGLTYVVLFSLGSIVGMLVFSIAISLPLMLTAKRFNAFHHRLQLFIGFITSGIGIVICAQF
jgi:ABC-type nickel/cobalt efflux system permease component RcnA